MMNPYPFGTGLWLLRQSQIRAQDDDDDCRTGSGYGHRRPRLVGDVVSLGYTTLILFWIIVFTVLMGLMIGLAIG
jgi:hypothetical protein